MTSDWEPERYSRFEAERTQPAIDLLSRVRRAGAAQVVDLGCGPGNSTELLVRRFPEARVVGVDSSAAMVEAARRRLPHGTFVEADLATWRPDTAPDVIFANAVLQWLPDHEALLPALLDWLAPGGSLAVQMPDNLDEPSHVAMRETAAMGPWAARAGARDATRTAIAGFGDYHRWLRAADCTVDLWRTTYVHPLGGTRAIVEWFKSTGLKPYLDVLSADETRAFLAIYEEKLARAYPAQADGTVLLGFPRLFIVARRSSRP